jgi:hypothetical protein
MTKTRAAVLVNMTRHSFSNELTDKKIAAEVAASHNASAGSGRYLKVRLPPSVLTPVDRILSQAYQYHCRATAPWLDRGVRMMPAGLIPEYTSDITMYQGELQVAVLKLVKDLPKIDAEVQRLRGSLYTTALVPSAEELQNCYGIEIELLPVPLEEDFRVDFLEEKFRKKFTENSAKRLEAQGEHAKQLMISPLLKLRETFLSLKTPRVRTSTIDQLTWVCEHAGDIALDEVLAGRLVVHAESIKRGVLAFYNPEGRPKFDMEAIEEALETIEIIHKDLNGG